MDTPAFKRCSMIAVLLISVLSVSEVKAQLPAGFIQKKIAEGLDPTRITQSDDGRIFVTEKKGTVRVVKDGVLLPDPFISIPVDNLDERGLAGIAMDPDFGNNQYFYLYYAVPGENHNRVSRFKASGDFADPASETILIDFDGLWWQVHNGGSLAFGPDGKLYISVGDGANTNSGPQNLGSTLGKVLRINSDGTIPEDNPFYQSTTGVYRSIYAMGFRNPFSLTINPVTGQIIVGDVGNNSYEELNNVLPGKNYGWPIIEGPVQPGQVVPENYQPPLYYYGHDVGCSVIGGTFYLPWLATFPQNYLGKYFFSDYCNGKIKVADPSTGEILEVFASGLKSVTNVFVAHDGSIYYISRGDASGGQEGNSTVMNGSLWQIEYTGSGVPYVSDHPSDVLIPEGESATFSIRASGTNPLSYQWYKNGNPIDDATESTYVTPLVSLADDGTHYACKVTNDDGEVMSDDAILSVTANTRPVVTIETPTVDYLYSSGDKLSLKGNALDNEDGELDGTLLTWTITFHHNDHTHPGLAPTNGTTAEFDIPLSGETSANVYYEISLTATDSEGLVGRTVLNIQPKKATMTFQTEPAGLAIKLDGQSISTPTQVEGVVRTQRSLEAPAIIYDNTNMYRFVRWSNDVTTNPLTIHSPMNDSTITAFYTTLALGDGNGLTGEYFDNQQKTFEGTATSIRVDPNIDFDWNVGSPIPGTIGNNKFTARWTGYLEVPFDGLYTFHLRTDDGSKLYIQEELVVDNWAFNDFLVGSEKSGTKELKAGRKYRVKMEYFENQSLSFAKLFWSSDSIPKSIVPHNQLFLTNTDNQAPVVSIAGSANLKFGKAPFTLKGIASDFEDGSYDPKKIVWSVDLHHDEHIHNLITSANGLDSLIVSIPADHDLDEISLLRVTATISDFEGLTSTVSADIYPDKVSVSVATKPVGITYKWNNSQTSEPINGIRGTLGVLEVEPQVIINSTVFKFYGWEGAVAPLYSGNVTIVELSNSGQLTAVFNGQPKAQLINPDYSQKLVHNKPVVFQGSGFDIEDDVMTPSSFKWNVVIFDSSMNPDTVFTTTGVESLTYAPDLSHIKDLNSFGRVVFTVTDSRGAKATISTDLQLSLATLQISSSLAESAIKIDQTSYPSPISFTSISGTPHTYYAQPKIVAADNIYVFDYWGAGLTDNPLVLSTPASDSTLTIEYKVATVDDAIFGVKVYPNPVVKTFSMDWGPFAGSFVLTDGLGRLYSTGKVLEFTTLNIDLSDKGSGLYYLKITIDSRTRVVKLLKM